MYCDASRRQLELRRQLDVDGWAADVTSLRKTLASVDRKLLQMRLIDRCAAAVTKI
jgi:coiled-coil domain-containing protein 77